MWGAWPFHRAALVNARHGAATMDTLVSVGVTASVLALAAWLILVFAADRQPRHRTAAGATPLPQRPRAQEQEREQPEHKAAA